MSNGQIPPPVAVESFATREHLTADEVVRRIAAGELKAWVNGNQWRFQWSFRPKGLAKKSKP